HPDLASKLVPGWNFYDNSADTSDVAGHGTLVAGAAAAIGNNGVGVAGPAFANPIMPIRVTNTDGWALQSAIVSGLMWAADHGAKVANLSFGGVHSSSAVTTAAQYFASKGGLVTASAGNFGNDDGSPDNLYMVSVSATASNDAIATWSSFGSYVDVAAPGSSVWTTANGGAYTPASGTSFSAPVTAGVLALIFAANPSLTPAEAEEILEESADDLGAQGYDILYGWGRVNAGTAVMVAQGGGSPAPDTTPPIATITSPPGSANISGSVTIAVTAVDDTAVTEVRFYADGALAATDASDPYSALWDSATVPDGVHTLLAEAYDAAGNRGASQAVAVTVQNAVPDTTAPVVQVSSPADGAVLSGAVTVAATASDDNAVAEVRLYVNGALNWTGAASPLSATLDTTTQSNGPYTVHAEATDLSGNVGVSAPITVQIANGPPPPPPPPPAGPVVVFTSQANGISVDPKKHLFPVEVTGPNPILYVEFEVDGIPQRKKDKRAPYAFKASTGKWAVGLHTVTARATDALGKTGEASVTVTRALSEKERLKLEKQRLKAEKKKKKKKNK
ncbi:MAG: S8 family serine peptidase, partial [Phycisphaerae bacterium]